VSKRSLLFLCLQAWQGPNELRQLCLADLDRFAPQIAAVELDQIERPWRSSRRVRMPQKSGFSATGVP